MLPDLQTFSGLMEHLAGAADLKGVHEVPADAVLGAVAAPGPEPCGCGPVRLGARAAPALQRLVLAQPLDEVSGRRPR